MARTTNSVGVEVLAGEVNGFLVSRRLSVM